MCNFLFLWGTAPLFLLLLNNDKTVVPDTPKISVSNTRVVEGNSGQRSVEVVVALSQPATDTVSVTYNTNNGTASGDSDYVAATGTVSFNPGERMKKISRLENCRR